MRRLCVLVLLVLLIPWRAGAHIGSPDVFYKGQAGPYPTAITIRMPGVVPGRAELTVLVRNDDPVTVSFAPISSETPASNAPPAEAAQPVNGEINVFSGELWLMTEGAYSIDVRIHGSNGDGSVRIPVNSIATKQLPLPRWLGGVLLALGAVLFCGAVAIVAAAAGESVAPPGITPGNDLRRRYWTATTVSATVFAVLLFGGKKWWDAEEANFRLRLHEGGWPPMATSVRQEGSQRILRLTLGDQDWDQKDLALARDHGKLLHLFLMREPDHGAFAHVHPVRTAQANTFDVAVPPLPAGDYEILCDLTLERSGLSSTATNVVHIPAAAGTLITSNMLTPDPDDSWTTDTAAVRGSAGSDTIFQFPGGAQMIWKAHPVLRAQQDSGLRFEVRDANGKPALLEPYMGMLSHAAVLRSDGRIFSHVHPTGNFSMAAQIFFDKKLSAASGGGKGHVSGADAVCGEANAATSAVTLPYQFPTPGDYRLWIQIKTGGEVKTAIFDTTVL